MIVAGCTKDLSEVVAGQYAGRAEIYFWNSSPSLLFVNATIVVVKSGQTTVTLNITSDSTQYNGSSEFDVKYNGTFGTGFHTPTGSVAPLGNEGRFIHDSLYFSHGNSEYIFSFSGQKR